MIVYKLFRQRKDGTIGPLFINRSLKVPVGQWLVAEDRQTKGFAHRPGWHSGLAPVAAHLTEKDRVWAECEVLGREYTPETEPESFSDQGDMPSLPVCGWYRWKRPANQGGQWIISSALKVRRILSQDEVEALRAAQ